MSRVNRDGTVTEAVTLPQWMWGRLATRADELDIPLAGLIGDALRRELDGPPKPSGLSRLELLQFEVEQARESGWRPPRRGRRSA